MSQEFEIGTVKWFNPQLGYGFIEVEYGQVIFFHINDGRYCRIEDDELQLFIRQSGAAGKFAHVPDPVEGDHVQFIRSKGSKGRPKASPWTYEYMVSGAYVDDFHDNEECMGCGHKMFEHSGPECMHNGCHCGDESYELDQDDLTQVWYTEGPGGHNYYE